MEAWMVELNGIEASRSHRERDTVALHERGATPPKPPGGRRFDPAAARLLEALTRNSVEVWMVELNGIEASRSHRERDAVALHERGAAPPKPPRRSTVRSSSRPAARSIKRNSAEV